MEYYKSKNGYYYKHTENGNVRVSIDDYNNYMNGGKFPSFMKKKKKNIPEESLNIGPKYKGDFEPIQKYYKVELQSAYEAQIKYDTIINNIHDNMFAQEIIKIAELLYDEINNNKSNKNNNQSNNNNQFNNNNQSKNRHRQFIKKTKKRITVLNIIEEVIEKRLENIKNEINRQENIDGQFKDFTVKEKFNYPKIKKVLDISKNKIKSYRENPRNEYFIFDSLFTDLKVYEGDRNPHLTEMHSILYSKL